MSESKEHIIPVLQSSSKSIIREIIEDQKAIVAYFKGELSLSDLKAKGIKFVKTI